MNYSNVKQIVLTEEQEQFFIETWENNSSYLAHLIIKEQLGLSLDKIDVLAKNLREEGKIRDKQRHKFSNSELETFKREHEEGLSINEIASMHQRDAKAIRRHLKVMYGGKIPKIIKNTRQGEIWKDIEGCDTHQVSDKGRIYVKSTNQIIYGYVAHGYRYVNITDISGKNHKYAVHRLVAQAFVPNPDNKPQVDHIDSNPLNNEAANLRWVDQEEQLNNEETKKKRQLGAERKQRHWKIKPLLEKIFEIEPDKMELIKMIIDYKD